MAAGPQLCAFEGIGDGYLVFVHGDDGVKISRVVAGILSLNLTIVSMATWCAECHESAGQ